MELANLLSPEKWQEFCRDFHDKTKLNAFAIGADGEHLPVQRLWANPLCPTIRGNPKRTEEICEAAIRKTAEKARMEKSIVVSKCGAGLLHISMPVFLNEEYLGVVGGCGLLPYGSELDGEVVAQATDMGADVASMLGQNILSMSREDIEDTVRYLEDRIGEICLRYQYGPPETDIKTFHNLIEEVQKKGQCHQCGGCVTFCAAMQYGALELSETGRPRFRDPNKCIRCGVCYMICPAIDTLNDSVRSKLGWKAPAGNVEEVAVVRARNENIRAVATDGGAVTAILTHLFERGKIDGAAVTRQVGPFRRQPWLARSKEDVLQSAGSHFDRTQSSSVALYTQDYSTYSPSVRALGPTIRKGLENVALVGTPCQINTVRKMKTLGVAPSNSIYCTLGLFCSGNYIFGDNRRAKIERIGNFKWTDVDKVNIKDELILTLKNGEVLTLPLAELDFVKRMACRYCDDYAAEWADLSFGGIGAEDGWTTVIARTPLGLSILAEAKEAVLEEHPDMKDDVSRESLLENIERHSLKKKEQVRKFVEQRNQRAL